MPMSRSKSAGPDVASVDEEGLALFHTALPLQRSRSQPEGDEALQSIAEHSTSMTTTATELLPSPSKALKHSSLTGYCMVRAPSDGLSSGLDALSFTREDDASSSFTKKNRGCVTTGSKSEAMVGAALEVLHVGAHADPGAADTVMEDEHCLYRSSEFAFFGLYDGHCGAGAARFCRDNLHLHVMGSPHFGRKGDEGAKRALLDGFQVTEHALLHSQRVRCSQASISTGEARVDTARFGERLSGASVGSVGSAASDAEGETSGTAAIVFMLRNGGRSMHIAWVGDSRAVLCRKGRAVSSSAPLLPPSLPRPLVAPAAHFHIFAR